MKRIAIVFMGLGLLFQCSPVEPQILKSDVERIIGNLASDEMKGRRTFTPEIDMAADFIAGEFERIGIQTWNNSESYLQEFSVFNFRVDSITIDAGDLSVGSSFATSTLETVSWNQDSDIENVFSTQDFNQMFLVTGSI